MLQDFLANRPTHSSSPPAEAAPRHAAFEPFFSNRTTVLTAARANPGSEPEAPRLEVPEIELVEEAGQVRRIIVTCKCCEKITIDCEY